MASLALPTPPSWYPGHMRQFMRNLPAYLSRTDVVLELRDARLPLTSINTTFEGICVLIFHGGNVQSGMYPLVLRECTGKVRQHFPSPRQIIVLRGGHETGYVTHGVYRAKKIPFVLFSWLFDCDHGVDFEEQGGKVHANECVCLYIVEYGAARVNHIFEQSHLIL